MTVDELIKELQQYDGSTPVRFVETMNGLTTSDIVTIQKRRHNEASEHPWLDILLGIFMLSD